MIDFGLNLVKVVKKSPRSSGLMVVGGGFFKMGFGGWYGGGYCGCGGSCWPVVW